MSSDHYAQHIIQKHRLAVAIGLIQSKPENITFDQYILDLRNKMSDDKDDEFTICSEDFDVDFDDNDFNKNNDKYNEASQRSDTILKDFDDLPGRDENDNTDNIFSGVKDLEQEIRAQITNDENDIQSTFCETQPPEAYIARESLTDIDRTFCNSIANINQNEIIAIDKTCDNIAQIYQNNNRICENVGQFHKNQLSNTDKTYYNIAEVHDNNTMDIDKTVYESLPQVYFDKNSNKQHINKYTNIDISKTDSENTYCNIVKTNNNITVDVDQTFCESIKHTEYNKHHVNVENNLGVLVNRNAETSKQYLDRTTAYDSQATELYTFHTLEENYTHVSQSQNQNFDVSDKYIKGTSKGNGNRDTSKNIKDCLPIHVINTESKYNLIDTNLARQINKKATEIQVQKDNFDQNAQTNDNNPRCTKEKGNLARKIRRNLNKQHIGMQIDEENFDEITQTLGVNNFRNKDAHDQVNTNDNLKDVDNVRNVDTQIEIENLNAKKATDANSFKDYTDNDNSLQETQDPFTPTYDNFESILCNTKETQNTIRVHEISKSVLNNENMTMQVCNFTEINQVPLKTCKNQNLLHELSKTDVTNTENMKTQAFNRSQKDQGNLTIDKNKILTVSVQEIPNTEKNNESMTMQVNFNQNHLTNTNIDENESVSSEELSQSELVPFKVMEELNRVRTYVNRRGERRMSNESSLDSGYKSDSQGRSRSALQVSGNWIGQSAYCLYEHITRCPIVVTTQEIVGEVAQVLGQLIDRLHEEESYPSFLEELLECVDALIRDIFTEEDMLFEKDEKIQRLFLLNKSTHIQKYTIEKLTDILEDTHARLTDKEELYELTNIQKIENLSYIFHILEVIIKRHLKNKNDYNSLSQSQEIEKNSRKTSISDIWRKKWNPNFKEPKIDCSLEKKCVFKKCSEILNKMVVGCMDGYSLVAFAALQCFNLLQS